MRLERRHEPLLPARRFVARMARYVLMSGGLIIGSLLLGVCGYHWVVGLDWVDAVINAAFILTGMRVAKETLASIYDGVKIMHESTAYDMILDEGRVEGELRVSHRLLLRQGRKQFGPPDTQTEAALTAIQDIARLERMADAVLTAKSWEELLSTL